MMAIEGLYVDFNITSLKQIKTVISNNILNFFQFLTTFKNILAPYFQIKHLHKLETHVQIDKIYNMSKI